MGVLGWVFLRVEKIKIVIAPFLFFMKLSSYFNEINMSIYKHLNSIDDLSQINLVFLVSMISWEAGT